MTMTPGFKVGSLSRRYYAYGEHIITLAEVAMPPYTDPPKMGWSLRWERGPTMTLLEIGPLPTSEECVEQLWKHIFETTERRLELERKEAERVLRGA